MLEHAQLVGRAAAADGGRYSPVYTNLLMTVGDHDVVKIKSPSGYPHAPPREGVGWAGGKGDVGRRPTFPGCPSRRLLEASALPEVTAPPTITP